MTHIDKIGIDVVIVILPLKNNSGVIICKCKTTVAVVNLEMSHRESSHGRMSKYLFLLAFSGLAPSF